MAKIIIRSECGLYDGMPVTFKAPCACNAVDGLKVQYEGEYAEFTFKDAHGNDLTGLGNLFDKGAVVKAILDTESGSAYVQNADTNAYLEGRFGDMVQSVNGQKGDVILTADRIGAAASSVMDITVKAQFPYYDSEGDYQEGVTNLNSKLYTSGKLFALDVPVFGVGEARSGSVTYSLPDGYRMLDISAEQSTYGNAFTAYDFPADNVYDGGTRIAITHANGYSARYRFRVYGCIDGDAAGGSGGVEPDWVQAVIDAAQRAEDTAGDAKAGTEQFAARIAALDIGLSDAKKDIENISTAQRNNAQTLKTAADDIAAIKKEIEDLTKDDDTRA